MKYKQSSSSLHCQSTNILTIQSSNRPLDMKWRMPWKTQSSVKKQYANLCNARGRLKIIGQQMQVLQDQSKSVDLLNKELHLKIKFLQEEYIDHRLNDLNLGLNTMIKELKKKVTIKVRTDLLKYESIKNIYDSLNNSHKQLVYKVREIEERVELLQNVMGIERTTTLLQNE